VIAFLPEGKTIDSIGNPPSLVKLKDALNVETPPGQMPPVTTAPAGVTPTTQHSSTATTKPASATPTSKP
jgi:hypothetical protein